VTLDILGTNLPGQRLLAVEKREALGELKQIERTSTRINGQPRFRYSYSFTLPDGTLLHGASYGEDATLSQQRRRLPGQAELTRLVTVEYHPAQPSVNRIKWTQTGAKPASFLPWALIPLPIAGAVLVAGLRRGARRVRLLADGRAAEATLRTWQFTNRRSRPRPFSDYLKRRDSSLARGDILTVDPEDLTPEQRLARGSLAAMGCLSTPLLAFGIIVLGVGLGLAIIGKEPTRINGVQVSRGLYMFFLAAFLAAWIGFCRIVFHRSSGGLTPGVSGAGPPGVWNPRLTCTFAFHRPDDRLVATSDDVVMNDRIGARPTEPVLYDPADPRRALLLNGLVPPVRIGPSGAWETAEGIPLVRRLVVAVLSPLAGPLLAWIGWSLA
jgi:hypothetical protein